MRSNVVRARRRSPAREADCVQCTDRKQCWSGRNLLAGVARTLRGLPVARGAKIPDGTYFVNRGVLKLVNLECDGTETVLDFKLPGDLLLLRPQANDLTLQATALTDVILCRLLPPNNLESDAAAKYWRLLAELVCDMLTRSNTAWINLPAAERVAWFLSDLARRMPRNPDGRSFDLPMSRAEIGSRLGLTEESVCRALRKLPETAALSIQYRTVTP